MTRTRIEWCDFTWNPVIGCRGGCSYCYARRMATRFHMTADFGVPTWSERNFSRPFPRRPSRIFVNSMSDVADWGEEWFTRVNIRIIAASEHLFLFLSKRPWRSHWDQANRNAMLGYSAIDQFSYEQLLDCGFENVSFLSLEPLLGPIPLAQYIHRPELRWIIIGAETGNRKGKVMPDPTWLKTIYEFATERGIPLFFKDSLRPYWPFDGYDYFPREFPGRAG